MTRRWFLSLFAVLTGGFAASKAVTPIQAKDCLVFRGETVSVFNRDGTEIVCEGASREYNSALASHDGYRGERPFISWFVRYKTKRAYGGYIERTFYGKDARHQAENAARTWVLASLGGWPTFVPPDQVQTATYGDGPGCLPLAK